MTLSSTSTTAEFRPLALCAPRTARRLARLSHLRRLHRARRHGDRRRRLVLAQPHRWPGPRRPRHPGRRSGLHADPSRGQRRRARVSSPPAARSRSAPRCGRWRAPPTTAARWSSSRRSMAAYPLYGTVTLDPDMPLDRRSRSATACSAPRSIRRCWRGSTSSRARASPSAAPRSKSRRHQERARQARQRHRLRPARDRQRGRAARHRPARRPAASCAGTIACGCRTAATAPPGRGRGGRDAIARCRLADPQAHQCLAGAGTQRRALHPVPDAGRPHRAAGRRRRRRQRGEEPSSTASAT